MAQPEWSRVEAHLNKTFNSKDFKLKTRESGNDSKEVYKADEFLGLIEFVEDEGEASYMFEMAILDIDLD